MKMKMDALHYALLAVVVLLAVYCASRFLRSVREGNAHKEKKSEKYFSYNPHWRREIGAFDGGAE